VVDVEALLRELSLDEKAALTAGEDFFSTTAIDRLHVPKVRLTDGPNGARGVDAFPGVGGLPSTCTPCASALGATWDPKLVREVGELIAREARDRGCHVLLAPTLNLHRSPLAGRNFECYSEDPLLAGRLGAAYVKGVQSRGVVATVKHFVGNDAEFERMTISSEIDERSLREIYLLPFELAITQAAPLAVMTAYNKLNGRWLTQRREFLIDLLRDEWGFDGIVMTDWFGMTEAASVAAGLDLEMPGPPRVLGPALAEQVGTGAVSTEAIDTAVRRLLEVWDRVGALDEPTPAIAPVPPTESDTALLRRASAQSVVLLANDGTLPLVVSDLHRVAVIGPHASRPRIMGGGAASVVAYPVANFVDALRSTLRADVEVVHERGCEADRNATVLGAEILTASDGFTVEVFDNVEFDGDPVQTEQIDELRLMAVSFLGGRWPEGDFSLRVRGTVTPSESSEFEFALSQAGRARVFLDGELVLDGVTNPPPPGGTDFFGMASQELVTARRLQAEVPVEVVVEYAKVETPIAGFRVGFRTVDIDVLIERAVAAAAGADAAVVVVGTTEEWETETRDRDTLSLPGRQADLIRAVAGVTPRTVVVVNAGAPVDLSWVDDVAAVALCWFGGQEMAPGVVDVLLGAAEPGGRLPTTIPRRLEDNPSHGNFPGEGGTVTYAEGVFMGYRGYEGRQILPQFAFGHGLSYTTFEFGTPDLSAKTLQAAESIRIVVPVTNTGPRAGSEVVQCYVAPVEPRVERPPKELKDFVRVWLEPGESTEVELSLGDRAFAYWATGPGGGWTVDPGRYVLEIGVGSDAIVARCEVDVVQAREDASHEAGT
jgi:beta-glucosidase